MLGKSAKAKKQVKIDTFSLHYFEALRNFSLFELESFLLCSPYENVYLHMKIKRKSLDTASIEGKQEFTVLRQNNLITDSVKRPLLLKGHLVDSGCGVYKQYRHYQEGDS